MTRRCCRISAARCACHRAQRWGTLTHVACACLLSCVCVCVQAGGGTITNTIIFTHSMGSLIAAAALHSNTCSFGAGTKWFQVEGPLAGAKAADVATNMCNKGAVKWLAKALGFCSGASIQSLVRVPWWRRTLCETQAGLTTVLLLLCRRWLRKPRTPTFRSTRPSSKTTSTAPCVAAVRGASPASTPCRCLPRLASLVSAAPPTASLDGRPATTTCHPGSVVTTTTPSTSPMWCVRCNVRRYIPRCELVVTPLSRPLLCPRTTLMARAGMETVRLCGFACDVLRS